MHLFWGTKLLYKVFTSYIFIENLEISFLNVTYLTNLFLCNNELAASTCGISLILFFYLLEDLLAWHLKVVKEIFKGCSRICYNIFS